MQGKEALKYKVQDSNSFNYAEEITKIYFSKIEKFSRDVYCFLHCWSLWQNNRCSIKIY